MLVWESGPFEIFDIISDFFHVGIDEDGEFVVATTEVWWRRLFGGILSCLYCISVWISFALCLLVVREFPEFLLWWFAVSAGAIFIDEVLKNE